MTLKAMGLGGGKQTELEANGEGLEGKVSSPCSSKGSTLQHCAASSSLQVENLYSHLNNLPPKCN